MEYKLDLLEGLEDGFHYALWAGKFQLIYVVDQHIQNTGFYQAGQLTNIAGAYWERGWEAKNAYPVSTEFHFPPG